ncbi:hypothetical protein DVA85_28850, partial [Acinetobacter sp. RIT592]
APIDYIKKDNKKSILIFIHGFTSSNETWINSSEKSFPEMLLKEEDIKDNFDMAYFNYFTKLSDFHKTRFSKGVFRSIFKGTSNIKKNIGIKSLSDHLKSAIDIYCHDYENIILVAHSMGGLISKSYILEELELNKQTNVKLFISLAVPHKGSDWANIGEKLFKSNKQIIDLNPQSEFLDKINNNWVQSKDTLPKTVYYYGQYDDIVEEISAVSYQVEKQLKVACNNDHFNICKPESEDSIVYSGVKRDLLLFNKENRLVSKKKNLMKEN